MNAKILIIIILCFAKIVTAQDVLRVETVVDSTFRTPQYIDAFDDVFLSHQEAKWLIKVDFMGLLLNKKLTNTSSFYSNNPYILRPFDGQDISLSFERKITSNFSINTQLSTTHNFLDHEAPFRDMPLALTIEPRFYLGKKAAIKNGKSGNNLNGSYIGVGLRLETTNITTFNLSGDYGIGKWVGSVNYGLQKRIFNNWYLDYKLGIGVSKGYKWGAGVTNQFALGWAFGTGKRQNVNACDMFRCFETEKSLWKVDIRKIWSGSILQYIYSDLTVGYEQKLGNTAWSLNIEIEGGIGRNVDKSAYRYGKSNVSMTIEPRFYYGLKKRIAKGLSVDNLSGCYLSLAASAGYKNEFYGSNSIGLDTKEQYLSLTPKWGIQKRIFRYGYADFSLAPIKFNQTSFDRKWGSDQFKKTVNNQQYSKIGNIPVPIVDFKIGFAF